MIEEGDRVLLVGGDREYYLRAGGGTFGTDHGIIDLSTLTGANRGDIVKTHLGAEYMVRIPRAPDFFSHIRRSGAPMLPKDIGLVIAYTGMNKNDRVLDAGTGSGVAAIFFGGIAREVTTYESRPEFARIAAENMKDAKLSNVEVVAADFLEAGGTFDIVHLDLHLTPEHVAHAHSLLNPGGSLACYTPFLEHMQTCMEEAQRLFSEVHTYECSEREMTRTKRGTRPSTRVCHSGYVTVARK